MPLYEYKCPNGHLFEVFHGMTEEGPQACEVCGASPVVRVLHPVAVHYKSSGFYTTDYGRKSKPARDGARFVADGGPDSDKLERPARSVLHQEVEIQVLAVSHDLHERPRRRDVDVWDIGGDRRASNEQAGEQSRRSPCSHSGHLILPMAERSGQASPDAAGFVKSP